ncbi:hypothetical protein C471_09265 [Halorubrum saccharovorum DSM 1137]|uniref:Uncharacterized protein n=1 Tax=Halorubrum saccharovorum DSM 1137 TaxID=1227484 RepID=M0DV96_9EURY|nr:DUF5806 family protein [Halorubrum saccharovorum]ELZ38748.1 hypothetical protein C471_09265 [Halorubrum saccharovorum DSM 1137]
MSDAERTGGDADGVDDQLPDLDEPGKYERFTRIDSVEYDVANEFLREYTTITAREWAIACLCRDFETETGVRMTFIGENLPELVPFMTDTYSPQAVNQARYSYDEKAQTAANTFFYAVLSGRYSIEEIEAMVEEARETAETLIEVETGNPPADNPEADDAVADAMASVWEASRALTEEFDEPAEPENGGDRAD